MSEINTSLPSGDAAPTPTVLRWLPIFMVLAGAVFLLTMIFAGLPIATESNDPQEWIGVVYLGAAGVLLLAAAWGLQKRRQWARILTMFLSVLYIFNAATYLFGGPDIYDIVRSVIMFVGAGFVLYWFATHPKEFH